MTDIMEYFPIEIYSITAFPPPRRMLKLSLRIKNVYGYDIWIVDSWVKVTAFEGILIDEGRLLWLLFSRSVKLTPPSRQNLLYRKV